MELYFDALNEPTRNGDYVCSISSRQCILCCNASEPLPFLSGASASGTLLHTSQQYCANPQSRWSCEHRETPSTRKSFFRPQTHRTISPHRRLTRADHHAPMRVIGSIHPRYTDRSIRHLAARRPCLVVQRRSRCPSSVSHRQMTRTVAHGRSTALSRRAPIAFAQRRRAIIPCLIDARTEADSPLPLAQVRIDVLRGG